MAESFLEKAIKEMDLLEKDVFEGNYGKVNDHLIKANEYLTNAESNGENTASARTRYDGLQEITPDLSSLALF